MSTILHCSTFSLSIWTLSAPKAHLCLSGISKNYYRLGEEEAVASVCDQSGDRGVDGIYVNDDNKTITVFQTKISQKSNSSVGDKALREFAGTLTQFSSPESVKAMMTSSKDVMLGKLIGRLDLINKISTHELRGEFISNIDSDQNGEDLLNISPHFVFIGKSNLIASYISDARDVVLGGHPKPAIGGHLYGRFCRIPSPPACRTHCDSSGPQIGSGRFAANVCRSLDAPQRPPQPPQRDDLLFLFFAQDIAHVTERNSPPVSMSCFSYLVGRFSGVHRWPVLGVPRGDAHPVTVCEEGLLANISLITVPKHSHTQGRVKILGLV